MQNWAVFLVCVIALCVVLAALAIVYTRMLPAVGWARSLLESGATAVVGAVVWLVLAPVVASDALGSLYLPVAALAGVAAFLASLAVRATGAGLVVVLVFALLWSVVVFVPVAIMSFWALGPLGLDPVDHGGSLPVNVAPGAAALGVLLAAGSRAPRLRSASLPFAWGVVAVIALTAGWLAWLAGAELAFDDVTPSILVNGLVGGVGGIAGWLVVQRILHQSTTISAVAAGLMSGLVSVAAGAPLFTPVSAAAAGVLSGAAACLFTLRRLGATRRQQWFIVGSHIVAGSVGLVLLGMLATDTGFLFTGQIGFIQVQIASAFAVAVYSTAVSFLLWLALARIGRGTTRVAGTL